MFRVYHHIRSDGTNIYLDTGAIYDACLTLPQPSTRILIEFEIAVWLHEHNCLDRARVLELSLRDPSTVFDTPLIVGTFNRPIDDETHMVIDGRHRYTLAATRGLQYLPCHIIPEDAWRMYEVRGPHITRDELRSHPVNPRRY